MRNYQAVSSPRGFSRTCDADGGSVRVGNYALYTCTVIYTVYSLPFVESTAVQMYMTVYVEISLVNGVVLEFTTVLLLYFLSVGFMVGRGHVGQVFTLHKNFCPPPLFSCTKISDPPPHFPPAPFPL